MPGEEDRDTPGSREGSVDPQDEPVAPSDDEAGALPAAQGPGPPDMSTPTNHGASTTDVEDLMDDDELPLATPTRKTQAGPPTFSHQHYPFSFTKTTPPSRPDMQAASGAPPANAPPPLFGTVNARPSAPCPKVHGWNAELTLANLDEDVRRLWEQVPEPKLFVYLWNGAYQENATSTVTELRNAIANTFSTAPPVVAPPSAATTPNRAHAAPWCFLVTTSNEVRAKLIQRQFWSTPAVTFFAIPFAPRISKHLGAVENMTFEVEDREKVHKLVTDTILASAPAAAHVRNHSTDPLALKKVVESVAVEPLPMLEKGGAQKLVWNVYTDPPSQSLTAHEEWRRIFLEMKFVTALHGVGRPKRLPGCVGCKSTDHPTGLCPFPKIEGSFARPSSVSARSMIPTSLQLPQAQEAMRGRGGRGRGAPAGRRGRNRGRGSFL